MAKNTHVPHAQLVADIQAGTIDTVLAVFADHAGEWAFRTIRPVPYPGRTPHIHFFVRTVDGRELVTQLYVAGDPGNALDYLGPAVAQIVENEHLVPAFEQFHAGVRADEPAAAGDQHLHAFSSCRMLAVRVDAGAADDMAGFLCRMLAGNGSGHGAEVSCARNVSVKSLQLQA